MAERIQQYALTKTVISLMTGLCTWAIALVFGLDFAAFWGLLAWDCCRATAAETR